MYGISIGKILCCSLLIWAGSLLGCGNEEDTISDETIVKNLSAQNEESLCDDIAQSLTDAEISTKEKDCTIGVWGITDTPEACEEAVAECIATPDEELDNIDAVRDAFYSESYTECTTDFVTDSATYTVGELNACMDAFAEARACIWNNDKVTCDTVSKEAADEVSRECTALVDKADALCVVVENAAGSK
jgi:hypothetical protein